MENFNELKIKEELLSAILDMGFSTPTPIQREVIPHMLDGKDCLAQAPTGSGKTCAFAIPALNRIDMENEHVQVLILCPTRELVMQTEGELKKLIKNIPGGRVLAVYGGQNIERQLSGLRRRPQVVVGTPGRIMDHLRRRTLKLEHLDLLVLDEADEMLNMGFRDDINVILLSASEQHQTVMFSATMSREILEISRSYQQSPVSVKTDLDKTNVPKIDQYYVSVRESGKLDSIVSILDKMCYQLVLVFCNTKARVDSLSENLSRMGYRAEALHGDLRQKNRDTIMKRYRSGDINVLVATDVAARGIDVEGIEAIFNFDVPFDNEYYVHRIGRTGRANRTGASYSFFSEKDAYKKKEFEKFTGVKMKPIDKELDTAVEGDDLQSFLSSALKEYNVKQNKNLTFKDLSDAVMRLNRSDVSMPENNSRTVRDIKVKKTTRYFVNLGMKDNLNESSLKGFVLSNTTLSERDIKEVKLLETFSFIETENGHDDEMFSLKGSKLGKREVSIEHADSAQRGGGAPRGGNRGGSGFSHGGNRSGGGGFSRGGGNRSGGGGFSRSASGDGERSFGRSENKSGEGSFSRSENKSGESSFSRSENSGGEGSFNRGEKKEGERSYSKGGSTGGEKGSSFGKKPFGRDDKKFGKSKTFTSKSRGKK